MKRSKRDYSAEETAELDAQRIRNAVAKGGADARRGVFGSSKHRGARIQKFRSAQKRKHRRR